MRRMIFLAAFAACAAAGQTQIDLRTQAKRVDFSAATATRPMKAGTALPATCAVGEMFFKTDAPGGANVYGCGEENQWSVQSAKLTVASEGTAIGSRPTANFLTGPGLISLISDTGSQIDVSWALDTAVVQTQAGDQSGAARLCAPQSGSSSDYRCMLDPTMGAYATGMVLHWIPDVSGAGGPTTLNVDTLGAARVKLRDGVSDPTTADIMAGQLYAIWYDGAQFRLTMPTATTMPGSVLSVFGRQGAVVPQAGDYTTDQVTEGGSLYFTAERARDAVNWGTLAGKPSTFAPSPHAASHRHGGSDEMATVTPAPNAIPKAGSDGKLDAGWLAESAGGLGYTAENAAYKGQANGYASLDETGKVPSAQIPAVPAEISNLTLTFDGSTADPGDGSALSWSCGSGSAAQCTTTWAPPEKVGWVRVQAWGGGSGGSGGGNTVAGSGGAGGGYWDTVCRVTPGAPVTITVGLGGDGSINENTVSGLGGDSSFGTCFTVLGAAGSWSSANGGWGGRLKDTPRMGWFTAPDLSVAKTSSTANCSGLNAPGSATARTDGGGCGAGQRGAGLAGLPGGAALAGGGGGGSGADHETPGLGGLSAMGGRGGNGGTWFGGVMTPCEAGVAPGGGGGGAGGGSGSVAGQRTGCAGARGEVRVSYVR
jgi:hypothetical protein